MPEAGEHLLTFVGFDPNESPTLVLEQGGQHTTFHPLDTTLTLRFDPDIHYCTGWRDITKGERFTCPDELQVEEKYEQCPACQQRTGFNPAFYNAATVSKQQEERNLQPHILYLAYFGGNLIKVGISLAARGRSRLLEQGARSAIILDTFPTAHIARHYEARIAAMPDIAEALQLRKKISSLASTYGEDMAAKALSNAKARIEASLNIPFPDSRLYHFDTQFFPDGVPNLTQAFETSHLHTISGKATGMIGSLLFCTQQDTPVFLPLKKYIGTRMQLSYNETPIELPAQQISLF